MAIEEKTIEAQKQEITETESEDVERTREFRCFIPRSDIYETKDMIVVVSDMPGVDENSVDITLEKNILTINGYVDINEPEGYSLAWAEFEVGDYQHAGFPTRSIMKRSKPQSKMVFCDCIFQR